MFRLYAIQFLNSNGENFHVPQIVPVQNGNSSSNVFKDEKEAFDSAKKCNEKHYLIVEEDSNAKVKSGKFHIF